MQLYVETPPNSLSAHEKPYSPRASEVPLADAHAGSNGASRKLFGYEVIGFLGEGAEAAVYAVMNTQTNQLYALKHVIKKDAKHQRFIDQIYNEFEVSKHIKNPHVRHVVEIKASRSILLSVTEAALVMELLDATPLDKLTGQLAESGTPSTSVLPVDRALGIMVQAARGMAAINSAGLVHCDIKPANIMVPDDTAAHLVKVIDLGHACPIGAVKKRIQGSPYFISPEQYKLQPVTCRTDVFNFGATLYWVLTGQNIPTAYTNAKGLTKLRTEKAASPRALRPEVPHELSQLTLECVRTDPTERPDTMSVVANRLGLIHRGLDRNSAVA